MKKIFNLIIIASMLFILTGCSNNTTENTVNVQTTSSNKKNTVLSSDSKDEKNTTSSEDAENNENVDYKTAAEKQMAMPEEGETIAIFHVKNFGDIKVKFFEDVAPKAVENFITHAKNGYYDGVTFHRVINEFMIQGGDPTGTGTGGESIWGKGFPEEFSADIVPYRGTLCMASSGTGTSSLGSQFFITQANYDENSATYMEMYGLPSDLIEQYKKYGGNILSLYYGYTVFGQVYEGMDVVDKIAEVKTGSVPMVINGVEYGTQDDKPVEDVIIETIEVTEYKGK